MRLIFITMSLNREVNKRKSINVSGGQLLICCYYLFILNAFTTRKLTFSDGQKFATEITVTTKVYYDDQKIHHSRRSTVTVNKLS